MGMYPVGYDLSVAGVPVHSTAFRPLTGAALAQNPFRVFTSLLRLELIEDEALRAESAKILSRRRIFTDGALALIEQAERDGARRRPMPSASSMKHWKPSAGMVTPRSTCRPTARCTTPTGWWPTWSASVARTSTT